MSIENKFQFWFPDNSSVITTTFFGLLGATWITENNPGNPNNSSVIIFLQTFRLQTFMRRERQIGWNNFINRSR